MPAWFVFTMLSHRSFRCQALTFLSIAVFLFLAVPVQADKATDDLNLGVGLWRQKRWTLAADTFEHFLQDYPNHPRAALATLYLGLSYSSQQKYAPARERFQEFLRLAPNSANAGTARFRIGECSYYLNEFQAAAAQLEEYVRLHQDDKLIDWGKLQLGESYIELGEWKKSEEVLRSVAATSTTDEVRSSIQYALATSLEKQDRPDDAVAAYRQVAQLPDRGLAGRALARAGTISFRQKQYDRASAFYDEIVSRFPGSRLAAFAALNSGLALHRIEKYEDALRQFDRVPDDSDSSAEAKLLSGMSLSRLGRSDEARTALQTAWSKAREPDLLAEILFEQARLERLVGQKDLAARIFVDLADRWPDDVHVVDALFNAANLRLELADHPTAARLYRRLKTDFAKTAAQPRIRVLEGRLLLARHESDAAQKLLLRVIDEDGVDRRSIALARYYLIRINHNSGKYAVALHHVGHLIPDLTSEANADLQGALALGAMSALQLDEFERVEQLATQYLTTLSNGPQATDAQAARTVARASLGSYKAALADARALIDRAPRNPQTWTAVLQSAELAWDRDEFTAAQPLFQQATDPESPVSVWSSGALGSAWCLYRLKQYHEAANAFQLVVEQSSDRESVLESRFMKARSLHDSGNVTAAIDEYMQVSADFVRKASSTEDAQLQARLRSWALDAGKRAARLLEEHDRTEEAGLQWSALANRFADSEELDAILDDWAWANMEANRYDEADRIYRRLLDHRPDSQYAGMARLSLAESDLSAGRIEEAVGEFQAIADQPHYAEAEKERSLFHLVDISAQRQDWDRVITLADRFSGQHSSSLLASRVQLLHADALLNQKPHDQAGRQHQLKRSRNLLEMLRRGVLEEHLEAEVWTERIWVVLGEVALETKDYAEVDRLAEEFVHRYPKPQHLFQIRIIQGRRWKNQPEPDFAKAREFFEMAIFDEVGRGTRTTAKSQFLIAETFLLQRNYSKAIREFFKVHTLYPYPELQARALYQAAACQSELGQQDEANLTLRTLIQEFPQSEFTQLVKPRLDGGS